ncbi:MAG: hypothetical protein H6Q02_1788 [Acidobacteria bacterium]|nr:hypothetical protein [Acidobacteriota bacterium]
MPLALRLLARERRGVGGVGGVCRGERARECGAGGRDIEQDAALELGALGEERSPAGRGDRRVAARLTAVEQRPAGGDADAPGALSSGRFASACSLICASAVGGPGSRASESTSSMLSSAAR